MRERAQTITYKIYTIIRNIFVNHFGGSCLYYGSLLPINTYVCFLESELFFHIITVQLSALLNIEKINYIHSTDCIDSLSVLYRILNLKITFYLESI